MLKDVLINIKGAQGSDGEESVIELTTDGRFGEKNGGFYITYDESEMIGIDNVKTSLYIKPDNSVILQRSGAIDSRIVVESGKRSVCYYNTPAGEMLIGIFGEKVEHNLKKNERLKNNVDFSRKSKGTDKQLHFIRSRERNG